MKTTEYNSGDIKIEDDKGTCAIIIRAHGVLSLDHYGCNECGWNYGDSKVTKQQVLDLIQELTTLTEKWTGA